MMTMVVCELKILNKVRKHLQEPVRHVYTSAKNLCHPPWVNISHVTDRLFLILKYHFNLNANKKLYFERPFWSTEVHVIQVVVFFLHTLNSIFIDHEWLESIITCPFELYTHFVCIKEFVNDFYRGLTVCFKVPCNWMKTNEAKKL